MLAQLCASTVLWRAQNFPEQNLQSPMILTTRPWHELKLHRVFLPLLISPVGGAVGVAVVTPIDFEPASETCELIADDSEFIEILVLIADTDPEISRVVDNDDYVK